MSSEARHARPGTPAAGDWIEVDSTAGGNPRRGRIVEVLGEGSHLHYRVRWDEQHESLFYPDTHGGSIVHGHSRDPLRS